MRGESARAQAGFPSTHWSTLGEAADRDTAGREALNRVLRRYLPALKAHLQYVFGMEEDRAEDLLQGFVTERILEKDLIARAERGRGRFRNLVLKSLKNYVYTVYRREKAKKRYPEVGFAVSSSEREDPLDRVASSSEAFEVAWAREVVAEAVRRLRERCEEAGRPRLWGVFEGRVLKPLLGTSNAVPYSELVARHRFESPLQASNALVTAKRLYAQILGEVIGEYVQGRDGVAREIDELRELLSRSGGRG
jgi:RNA polymerase sigma-70 factor (ECF subfamily)